jgi:NarL family two-component system sensor histidine kinase LiaS
MKNLFGLRWRLLRAVFLGAVITSLVGGAILNSRLLPVGDIKLQGEQAVIVAGLFFLLALVIHAFLIYQESKRIKKRLGDVTAFTAVLARGNLAYRMDILEKDEIGRVAGELNRLAETMENQVASLQRLADYNEELTGKVHSAAIIEERQRLARELHDAVSQQLFALTMLSEAVLATMEAGTEPDQDQVRDIAGLAAQVQQEMRALLLHLRPVQLDGETLAEGLESLANELEKKSGLAFEISLYSLPPLARGVENHLFRIVQEALANILRHAEAGKVGINLFAKSGELFLQISDDGKGFNPLQEKKASYGLKTMRERCEEIGGQIKITSREAAGTRIDIRIPLKVKEEPLSD